MKKNALSLIALAAILGCGGSDSPWADFPADLPLEAKGTMPMAMTGNTSLPEWVDNNMAVPLETNEGGVVELDNNGFAALGVTEFRLPNQAEGAPVMSLDGDECATLKPARMVRTPGPLGFAGGVYPKLSDANGRYLVCDGSTLIVPFELEGYQYLLARTEYGGNYPAQILPGTRVRSHAVMQMIHAYSDQRDQLRWNYPAGRCRLDESSGEVVPTNCSADVQDGWVRIWPEYFEAGKPYGVWSIIPPRHGCVVVQLINFSCN